MPTSSPPPTSGSQPDARTGAATDRPPPRSMADILHGLGEDLRAALHAQLDQLTHHALRMLLVLVRAVALVLAAGTLLVLAWVGLVDAFALWLAQIGVPPSLRTLGQALLHALGAAVLLRAIRR